MSATYPPLVLHLQSEAQDMNVPVSNLLRRAKVVATKLNIPAALVWIDRELNGYSDADMDQRQLPGYRVLKGHPKFFNSYRGWCTMSSDDPEMLRFLTLVFVNHSVGTLEALVEVSRADNQSNIRFGYPDHIKALLLRQFDFPTDLVNVVSYPSVWGIIDQLRTLVLNWTLELEAAEVLGEGLRFTLIEKERAQNVTNNYIAQVIGVAGNVTDHARVHNQMVASGGLDLTKIQDLVSQLQQMAPNLPPDIRDGIAPDVATLASEVNQPTPDQGKIAKALASVRATCEGAAGNLLASGAIDLIGKILGP